MKYINNSLLFVTVFFTWLLKKTIFVILISVLSILVFGLEFLILLITALVIIAFYVVLERKLLGAIQRRRGPNVVGF